MATKSNRILNFSFMMSFLLGEILIMSLKFIKLSTSFLREKDRVKNFNFLYLVIILR